MSPHVHLSSLRLICAVSWLWLNRSRICFLDNNLIYLRISKRCVLMTKILIDTPHLDWYEENSSMILSKLAEILKPRIRKKLFEENDANSKKSKLDIYRDSSFRFGYYFRWGREPAASESFLILYMFKGIVINFLAEFFDTRLHHHLEVWRINTRFCSNQGNSFIQSNANDPLPRRIIPS
jgi:hypothetical protein